MLLVMITKGQKPSLSRGCTKTLSTNTIERNLLSSKKLKVPLNTNQTIKNHDSKPLQHFYHIGLATPLTKVKCY